MATTKRFTIHVPYLVDRIRTTSPQDPKLADPEAIRQSFNQMMSELHRYLRYLNDSSDGTQENFGVVDEDIVVLGTDKLGHARVMIRVSVGF